MDTPLSEKVKILDKFITEQEQNLLTDALSGAIWRYGWPINTIPSARSCWHIFIAGSKRASLECCEHELASDSCWAFYLISGGVCSLLTCVTVCCWVSTQTARLSARTVLFIEITNQLNQEKPQSSSVMPSGRPHGAANWFYSISRRMTPSLQYNQSRDA